MWDWIGIMVRRRGWWDRAVLVCAGACATLRRSRIRCRCKDCSEHRSPERCPDEWLEPHSATTQVERGRRAQIGADGLTEAHVFERLGIKGCGEDVMARFSCSDDVKQEIVHGLLDASAGSQPSDAHQPQGDQWVVARLLSVSLPYAQVQPLESVFCHGNDYINRELTVCVDDDLRAVCKLKEQKNAKLVLHPSLRDPAEALTPYDYDFCQVPFMQSMARNMILWSHMAVQSSTEKVLVSRVSDSGKLPLVVQARATEAFKKGALVLVPAFGELMLQDEEADAILAKSKGTIHESMIDWVCVDVKARLADRRRKDRQDAATTPLVIHSPLLAAKVVKNRERCLENLPPFWALLRSAGVLAHHNMELEEVVLRDMGFEVKLGQLQKPTKGVDFTVHTVIARNSCAIAKDEVLCLPVLDAQSAA